MVCYVEQFVVFFLIILMDFGYNRMLC